MNTSFEIFHSVNELDQKLWNSNLDLNHIFLESEFLKNFEKNLNEKEIQPFYINFENALTTNILKVLHFPNPIDTILKTIGKKFAREMMLI